MKRAFLLVLLVGLSLSAHARNVLAQGSDPAEPKRATLYSLNKHPDINGRAALSFKTGAFGQDGDLFYGTLYVNEEHDWFQVGLGRDARSAFRDLGAHEWSDSFDVPFVEPFPQLKEGEQRLVSVDASGKDGEDGKPRRPTPPKGPVGPPVNGEESLRGSPIARGYFPPSGALDYPDSPGYVEQPWLLPRRPAPPPAAPGPKHDGVPKVDPVFVKAVVGHMYVIRVVDGGEDFYVLFRVDALARGDNCTITWKRVPPPDAQAGPAASK
jgi:hypothetical protein